MLTCIRGFFHDRQTVTSSSPGTLLQDLLENVDEMLPQ